MRSITLAQAAMVAAVAMLLLTVAFLIDNAALLGEDPVLVLCGSAVPSLVWAGFFFTISRRPSAAKTAAWITLIFGVLLEGVTVWFRFQYAVNYWTPFGNAFSLSGWLLRLGWAAFLISFALESPRTSRIALILGLISAPVAFNVAFGAFNNWTGLLFDELPRQAIWRALITPVIRSIYWSAQILFLWSAWGNPQNPTRSG